MRWFEASPRRAAPKGQFPSSPAQHRIKEFLLHETPFRALGAPCRLTCSVWVLTWHGHRVMIFGFLSQNLKTQAVAVAFSIAWLGSEVEPRAEDEVQARDRLAVFRGELYRCLTARADELFELADAVLCAGGPVRDLAGLSLVPEHRRGHGALYDAVSHGRIDIARLRSGRWQGCRYRGPRMDGCILAADVSNWLRPDAATSPDRLFCHVCGRGKGQAQMIPGWPYSLSPRWSRAARPGRRCWTRCAWAPMTTRPR